jgi:hypothetical protein
MPLVSLKLVKLDGTMTPRTLGLVDSGCDTTMLPGDWAQVLGIDFATDCEARQGNTAGGTTLHYIYPAGIDVIFAGQKLHLSAAFNPGLPVILLGREDFFACFRVAFDQRTKTFTVQSY